VCAQPELIVSSPLSRALHTADLAFPASEVPRMMLPLARERLWLSSDVGQPRRACAPRCGACVCVLHKNPKLHVDPLHR
jgi:broad specificity phosphatase PhoE